MFLVLTQPGRASASASAASAASDETLITRVAAGEALAMRVLFARHQTRVYRWLVRIVRDPTLAEDLLSEVFLDVWRQAGSFAFRSSVTTWLLGIARFKGLSAMRKRADAQLDEAAAERIADPADDAETALEREDEHHLLRKAVTQLSIEHREVLDLVYYHDRTAKEAAEIIGIPEATVKTRMFYARKKLALSFPKIISARSDVQSR
jgi:RNA polymerase sigma-70 factor (ECF subfamily)